MREWSLPARVRRARSTSQAVYLTERSIARYSETANDWAAQFEEARIDMARERLDRKSLLKIAAAKYFRPLRSFGFSF